VPERLPAEVVIWETTSGKRALPKSLARARRAIRPRTRYGRYSFVRDDEDAAVRIAGS